MHGVLEETLIFKTSDFVQFPKSSQYSPFPKKPLVMTTSSLLKKMRGFHGHFMEIP